MDSGLRKKLDSMRARVDNMAAESMGKDEKHADRGDSMTDKVRLRVKLERRAEKLVPATIAHKFDSMSDNEIRAAVIKHRHPNADLDGKSRHYIESRFDHMCEDFEDEAPAADRREAGRRMLEIRTDGEDGERFDADPSQARAKMLKSGREEWKSPLSASKKR